MTIGRQPSSSQIEIPIYKRSSDGLYWGNYPNGDKPGGLLAPASVDSFVAAALTTQIKARGSASAAVLATGSLTTSGGGSSQMKWAPGNYMNIPVRTDATNSQQAIKNSCIDIMKASGPNMLGAMTKYQWSSIQSTSATAYNWAFLDADYMRIAYTNGVPSGNRAIFQITVDAFSSNPATATPAFILNNSAYGPGANGTQFGYWTFNGGRYVCTAMWRPQVMSAMIALYQKLAEHILPDGFTVNNSPYVEQIQTWEIASPTGVDSGSGFSVGAYLTAMQNLILAANAAFTQTVCCAQANFCNDPTSTLQLVNFLRNNRWGGGGPDMFGYTWLAGISPFGGSLNKLTWGQQCFSGTNTTAYPVGTPGFSDLRGQMPWSNEVEDEELSLTDQFQAAPWIPRDIYDTPNKLLSKLNNAGGITHLLWQWVSGHGAAVQNPTTYRNVGTSPGNWDSVMALINALAAAGQAIPYTGYPANLP